VNESSTAASGVLEDVFEKYALFAMSA